MKRIKVGQRVRLAEPARVAVRFWSAQHGGIVGAGGAIIPREVLEGMGTIVSIMGNAKTSGRGLIGFDGSAYGLWLDAEYFQAEGRPAAGKE